MLDGALSALGETSFVMDGAVVQCDTVEQRDEWLRVLRDARSRSGAASSLAPVEHDRASQVASTGPSHPCSNTCCIVYGVFSTIVLVFISILAVSSQNHSCGG